MMATSFIFKFVPPMRTVQRRFNTIERSIRSFHEPLARSVRFVGIPRIQSNFEAGGNPPWEPLAESTIEAKGNDELLVDSGRGKQASLRLARWEIGPKTASMSGESYPPKTFYMQFQQEGTQDGHIPARPFSVFTEPDDNLVTGVFKTWMDEKIHNSGFRPRV
jgi:phage gpG-like protein